MGADAYLANYSRCERNGVDRSRVKSYTIMCEISTICERSDLMNREAIGTLIKQRRRDCKVTMADLTEGLCSQATLSRIEKGEIDNWGVVIKLLERLGMPNIAIHEIECAEDYVISQKLKTAIGEYQFKRYQIAWQIIDELAHSDVNLSKSNRQMYDMLNTLLLYVEKSIDTETKLSNLEKTLRNTQPSYSPKNLPKFLTFEEMNLLHNIARTYADLGQKELCIDLLYYMWQYFNKFDLDVNAYAIHTPAILYTLSKYLGQLGRYDECIEACKAGIEIEKSNGRCFLMHLLMYNYAWALVKRQQPGDKELAKQLAYDAYDLSRILEAHTSLPKQVKKFIDENCN